MINNNLKRGDKVWFSNGKKSFTVRESKDNFAICTQPFNFRPNTVIYTIIDFEREVRGLDNYVFGVYDYFSDEDCESAMHDLINGEMAVSYKTCKHVKLDIVKIKKYEK